MKSSLRLMSTFLEDQAGFLGAIKSWRNQSQVSQVLVIMMPNEEITLEAFVKRANT